MSEPLTYDTGPEELLPLQICLDAGGDVRHAVADPFSDAERHTGDTHGVDRARVDFEELRRFFSGDECEAVPVFGEDGLNNLGLCLGKHGFGLGGCEGDVHILDSHWRDFGGYSISTF